MRKDWNALNEEWERKLRKMEEDLRKTFKVFPRELYSQEELESLVRQKTPICWSGITHA